MILPKTLNLDSHPAIRSCYHLQDLLHDQYRNLTDQNSQDFHRLCFQMFDFENKSNIDGEYSSPMVLIGVYISIASLFCILAMGLDLFYGFRRRKYWFPTKYFSLNAATITVIAVAMKLPLDLTSSMLGGAEQLAKVGDLAFMCTMMSNFMPSLASMDNKSVLANITSLSILVITLIVNVFIQIRTHVVQLYTPAYIYMCMLLALLIILISSAITLPTSKNILEIKYQATSKRALKDQNPHDNLVEKLRQIVKKYWIMTETSNPQFVMASNPLSSASGIICAISMLMYIYLVWLVAFQLAVVKNNTWEGFLTLDSVYRWSMIAIVITQPIGIVMGSIAPIFRCFTVLSFKSFTNRNGSHFLVFIVEKSWTKKLCEWKESRTSFLSSGRRSIVLLHDLKNLILSVCIKFQKVIVVSCKIIGLIPIVVIILALYCSCYFKSLKAMLYTPSTSTSSDDTNEDLSSYVLLLEDSMRLAKNTMTGISDSMNRLIQNAEKTQHNNLLKLLEKSITFDGVEMFDTDKVPYVLSVEPVNSWSLPIISLTRIAIAIPNIQKDKVDNLLESVGEGLLYTHLVEESLNKASEYVNIRKTTMAMWYEVQNNFRWLETTSEERAFEGIMAVKIVKKFAHTSQEILNEFKRSTNGELVEKENLPPNIIIANSMYRIAQTIVYTYESEDFDITEDELFTRLSRMIAEILAACLTNIPRVIVMRCHKSAIEKRETSVAGAINLLGKTTKIIARLESHELPNMDPDKMGFIDEWRLHFKQL